MALITPAKRERRMQSYPLVYFLGILGLTDAGSYLRARDHSTYTSALIYTVRILFLHYYLPFGTDPYSLDLSPSALQGAEIERTDSDQEFNYPTDASPNELEQYLDEEEEPYEEVQSSEIQTEAEGVAADKDSDYFRRYDLFSANHQRFLLYYSEYPFSELANLLIKGSMLGKRQQGLSGTYWSDQMQTLQLSRNGLTLTLLQFRAFAQSCLDQAITGLNGLLYGMPDHCDLASLQDDLTNRERGYSVASSSVQTGPVPMEIFIDHIKNLLKDHDCNGLFITS